MSVWDLVLEIIQLFWNRDEGCEMALNPKLFWLQPWWTLLSSHTVLTMANKVYDKWRTLSHQSSKNISICVYVSDPRNTKKTLQNFWFPIMTCQSRMYHQIPLTWCKTNNISQSGTVNLRPQGKVWAHNGSEISDLWASARHQFHAKTFSKHSPGARKKALRFPFNVQKFFSPVACVSTCFQAFVLQLLQSWVLLTNLQKNVTVC